LVDKVFVGGGKKDLKLTFAHLGGKNATNDLNNPSAPTHLRRQRRDARSMCPVLLAELVGIVRRLEPKFVGAEI